MKIIKRGGLPEEKIYRATCLHCKTEVEFSGKEARVSDGPDQRDCGHLIVDCPVCKREIWGARPVVTQGLSGSQSAGSDGGAIEAGKTAETVVK